MSFAAVLERLQRLENPYPGLRPFEREEQHLFFGRDQQVAELAGRLERNRFVAVVGVSGSGKSSLVRAGLIPALERGSVGEAAARWRMVVTRPAGTPFASLAADLSKNGLDPSGLRRSSHGLVQVARQLSREETLLVVVDQFEELFRYKDREAVTPEAKRARADAASEASEFVQLLLSASRQQPPVYIVLTMRSDYLGDCAEFRDLPETLNACQYLVPRLTREQRKEAIEGPLGGTAIAPSLVQRILNDAGDEPDQLPILQHALMRTWNHWRGSDPEQQRRIEIQDYEAIGGFDNALNQHADELLSRVPEEIAATIFKRLTARGRGDRERRDPATLAELWALCGADTPEQQSRMTDVINHFRRGEATFLTPREADLLPQTYIDITHESLIRQWGRLRDEWLPEESRSARTFSYLVEWATCWKAAMGELLVGLDLTDALEWNRERNQTAAWASHYADEAALTTVLEFIAASQAREKKRAFRAKLNLWIAVALTLLFAALAGVAGYEWKRAKIGEVEALHQRHEAYKLRDEAYVARSDAVTQRARADQLRESAEQERTNAENLGTIALARQLAARAQVLLTERQTDLEPVVILATEAMERLPGLEADRALREPLGLARRQIAKVIHQGAVFAVAFSPDGRYVATGSLSKTARVFEAASGKEVARFTHEDSIVAVAFSPDGRYVATASQDKTARVFEAAGGKEVARLTHEGPVTAVAFTPDGRFVATGSWDDTARMFEAAGGKEVARLTHEGTVSAVTFSPDGRYLATGSSDNTARVFEAASKKEVARLTHDGWVQAVAFSPDGRYVATASMDDTARVFQAATGKEVARLTHQGPVNAVAFSPDGRYVATASNDATARVFAADDGKEVARLTHLASVGTVAFSPDGRYVATASFDNTARVFEAATGKEVARLTHQGSVNAVAFSRDGRYVATASGDATARVFEAAGGEEVARLNQTTNINGAAVAFSRDGRYLVTQDGVVELAGGKEVARFNIMSVVGGVAFSADGRYMATGNRDGTARVFEAARWNEVAGLTYESGVTAVALSAEGHRVATGQNENTAHVFEVASGKEVLRLTQRDKVIAVAFSPDGRYLATGSLDNTARVFKVASGKEVARFTHEDSVRAVAFSPDGRYLATGSYDNTARVFDVTTGKQVARLTHQDRVVAVAFSPDGRLLITGSYDRTARVFEVASGREMAQLVLSDPVKAIRYTEPGHYLMVASMNDHTTGLTVTRHLLRPQDLIAEACSRLTRNLTRDEWREYVGAEVPYHKTCPNLP